MISATGRARYEEMPSAHHDHLIDLQSGRGHRVPQRADRKTAEIIADELGYELVGHRLELYAVPRRQQPTVRDNAARENCRDGVLAESKSPPQVFW